MLEGNGGLSPRTICLKATKKSGGYVASAEIHGRPQLIVVPVDMDVPIIGDTEEINDNSWYKLKKPTKCGCML